jgi:hypothetical protein
MGHGFTVRRERQQEDFKDANLVLSANVNECGRRRPLLCEIENKPYRVGIVSADIELILAKKLTRGGNRITVPGSFF